MNTLTMTSGAALVTFSAVAAPGPVSSMSVVSGNAQSSMAGTPLASQVRFAVVDLFNNGVQGRVVTFSVQSGGGSISNSAATTDTDGVAVLNGWTLGRSAAPQAVRASFGNFSTTASASVQSGYDIDIRFFGPAMSSEQRAIFTNAAARIRGVVVGDIVNVLATNIDVVSACGATGVAPLNELIDDVIIYASIIPIDGPGKILGQAGPCLFRSSSSRYLTAVGRMQFDIDDIAAMAANGTLQDVIIHEMLHVLGIGQTFWSVNGLLVNLDLPTVGYVGLQGRQGCFDLGGAITCSGSVPVENTGGQGTAGAHWRESVFNAELMTGYSNVGPSPFSLITVGSLSDIGYVVNRSAADPFNPGNFSLRSQQLARPLNEGPWEKTLDIVPQVLRPDGKLEPLQKR
ncbi:MAG: leishmanolysin-related zinc metalloendopeptidase [Gemmatimonadales bacterium]